MEPLRLIDPKVEADAEMKAFLHENHPFPSDMPKGDTDHIQAKNRKNVQLRTKLIVAVLLLQKHGPCTFLDVAQLINGPLVPGATKVISGLYKQTAVLLYNETLEETRKNSPAHFLTITKRPPDLTPNLYQRCLDEMADLNFLKIRAKHNPHVPPDIPVTKLAPPRRNRANVLIDPDDTLIKTMLETHPFPEDMPIGQQSIEGNRRVAHNRSDAMVITAILLLQRHKPCKVTDVAHLVSGVAGFDVSLAATVRDLSQKGIVAKEKQAERSPYVTVSKRPVGMTEDIYASCLQEMGGLDFLAQFALPAPQQEAVLNTGVAETELKNPDTPCPNTIGVRVDHIDAVMTDTSQTDPVPADASEADTLHRFTAADRYATGMPEKDGSNAPPVADAVGEIVENDAIAEQRAAEEDPGQRQKKVHDMFLQTEKIVSAHGKTLFDVRNDAYLFADKVPAFADGPSKAESDPVARHAFDSDESTQNQHGVVPDTTGYLSPALIAANPFPEDMPDGTRPVNKLVNIDYTTTKSMLVAAGLVLQRYGPYTAQDVCDLVGAPQGDKTKWLFSQLSTLVKDGFFESSTTGRNAYLAIAETPADMTRANYEACLPQMRGTELLQTRMARLTYQSNLLSLYKPAARLRDQLGDREETPSVSAFELKTNAFVL